MKKFAVLLAILALMLCIVPCYAEETVAPDAPVEAFEGEDILLIAPAPVEPIDPSPVQPDDPLIGEATVGSDAPIAPAPDTIIEHPVAPTPDEAEDGVDASVDKDDTLSDLTVDEVLTTGSASESDKEGLTIEPVNFVDNLYYMAVGMVGIFIVIGLIVLATILLNRFFRDKEQKSE